MTIQTDDFLPAPPSAWSPPRPCRPTKRPSSARCGPRGWTSTWARPRRASSWRSSSARPSKRGEALDHVLLFGPPGPGQDHAGAHHRRTSWASTCARPRARCWKSPRTWRRILTNLEKNDVLFIDEIHRLSPVVEEILYPALEDYQIDIMIGEGPAARSHQARPAALHAGGRHHARRHADQPAARPLRHRRAAGVLHAPRSWRASSRARPGC